MALKIHNIGRISIIPSWFVCNDAYGIGVVRTQWGWRIMLIWWHICIHTKPYPGENYAVTEQGTCKRT
jgi:hypothetical protein